MAADLFKTDRKCFMAVFTKFHSIAAFKGITRCVLLNPRQAAAMDTVMQELGKTFSDHDVNAVASQHFDAQQVGNRSSVLQLSCL